MKVKIELDMTPDEMQDLFIPSNKQKEFAQAMYSAYIEAMTKAAGSAVKNTIGKVFREKKNES
jgi:hypothetical protein